MEKYTEEQLSELAVSVFRDDKNAACYHADENGTFLNEDQYALRSDAEKKAFKRFDNPNKAKVELSEEEKAAAAEAAAAKAAADAEKAAKKAEAAAKKAAGKNKPQ